LIKIVKPLKEGHNQLHKASQETNKRLNPVFEEQHHRKRDKDCLYQDIKKLFNVYQNKKPKLQGHVMSNSYHQVDIKTDAIFVNNARSPSQYQDGDKISCSAKEALKHLPEASSWPKFSGTVENDHMELIDVPSITDYWITARLNTAFKGNATIWVDFQEKPREKVAEVTRKKNSGPNCRSEDHYDNNSAKEKKKVHAIEKVPEEECPTEESESDSKGDSVREKYDEEQDPREESLVEYQEKTPLEIQEIQLEAGMPQNTARKTCAKNTSCIAKIIKEIIIPHRKSNITLNPEFVVLEDAPIQQFLLGTDYQRMYGIEIYNSENMHITIGTNKKKKFSLNIYQVSTHYLLEELLN
ncbi:hypothetical protein O181_090784, partial [Austropuccinia psidii MF-1]|nr:hypothetical protein [Austropuccinia psidii MF-1]